MREPTNNSLKQRLGQVLEEVKAEPDDGGKCEALLQAYGLVCKNYTARTLTSHEDTFPEISSLMGKVSDLLGNYYAGLWERNLVHNLQWYTSCDHEEIYDRNIAPR